MKLLALDLSSNSTGYAVYCLQTGKLEKYGFLKGKTFSKLSYPQAPLEKIRFMVSKVNSLILEISPDFIVVEEINRGVSRIGQKVLDGLHFLFLNNLSPEVLSKISYMDSDGRDGWRTRLGMVLTDEDKEQNKRVREFNKKVAKEFKQPVLTRKHITERWVNKKFNTSFDIEKVAGEADVVDAIGLGWAKLLTLTESSS